MDSNAALRAALAIAQVDRKLSQEEIELIESFAAMEQLDRWDRLALLDHARTKKVDLRAAVDAIHEDADRKYTLTLCFAMALSGGISPPESDLIRRIATAWGYGEEVLKQCLTEGQTLFTRLRTP